LFSTLRTLRRQQEEKKAQDKTLHDTAENVAVRPWSLGEDISLIDSSLAPDGRRMLVVTSTADDEPYRRGKVP